MTTDSTAVAAPILRYGGFWNRVVATVVDNFVLGFTFAVVGRLTGLDLFDSDPENLDFAGNLLALAIAWLYEALLTSSPWGATVGKRALKLRVVTEQGERISFARASGRFFAKILSALLLFVGFLMVAFTERKRGLHDMLAGTVVVQTD